MPKESSRSVRVFYPRHSREEVVVLLRQRVEDLHRRLPLKEVVLFGSYARGNYTVASDIDLLVVYQGPARADAYSRVKKAIGLPMLEPHVYCEAESRQQQAVIQRMVEGGVRIYEAGQPA